MSNLFTDSFCHQVDIIVPNKEKVFDQIKDLFKKYYFLSQINLSELLSDNFIDKFLNNGDLYLYSLNTKLDCDTCACLTPSGRLTLSVPRSMYDRIPINFVKKSIKYTGYEKYETELLIAEVKKSKDFDLFKNILKKIKLSFFAFWMTKDSGDDPEKALKDIFGTKRVFSCLNRMDCQVTTGPSELIQKILFKNIADGKDWTEIENLLGCLINRIDLKNYFEEIGTEITNISFLRIKGFFPNRIVKDIIQNHLKYLVDDLNDNKETGRVILKVHGFRDSPLGLIKLDPSLEQKMRTNEENFVGISFKFDQNESTHDIVYRDFKKIFIVYENK